MHKSRHYFSRNKPILGDAFKSEDAKEFLQKLLEDLYDAYTLKHFLTIGHEEYYKEKIAELSKHFYVVEVDTKNERDEFSYLKVKRCIDGVIFSVGDKVLDKLNPARSLPIGRMYEDERGLHVRLDMADGSFTWRDLSRIEQDLPF